MAVLSWMLAVVGILLQLAIIAGLLRGAFRTYPFLMALMVTNFLGTVASMSAMSGVNHWTPHASRVFWICDTLQYLMIFAMQVHLLTQGLSGPKARRRVFYLIGGGMLFVAFATWGAYHPRMNLWMTQMVRNFSFGSMILNLALWTTLLRTPERSRLMITGAVGLLLAASAIGHSLRQMAQGLVPLGNFLLVSSYFLYLFLLWRATVNYNAERVANAAPSEGLHPAGSPLR
ncbi:MAG: hypothetical protein JNK48_17415 [Bryobacterales bacterium]|nr:hypothetical protein [Bryobacterales bacterium]